MMNKDQSVTEFFKDISRTADGLVWIICSVISVLAAVLLAGGVLSMADARVGRHIMIFLFAPLILLLVLVNLRLLPFANRKHAVIFRVIVIVAGFLILNF